MHGNPVVSHLEVATLHVSPAVRVIGAGPLGERVLTQPRHQGDVVMVVVGTVVVVSVRQGTLSWLVMTTMTMEVMMVMVVLVVVLLVEVVMVVIVLWRIIMRNLLQYRVRLGQLDGETQREGGRGPPYGGSARTDNSLLTFSNFVNKTPH